MVPVITSNWSYSPSSLFLRLESCSWLRGTIHKCCWFSFNPIFWHLHGAPGSSASSYLGFDMYYYVQPGLSIMFCYASCMAPCVQYLPDKAKSTKTQSFSKHAVAAYSWYSRASSGSLYRKTTSLTVLTLCQKDCLINFCFYKLTLWSFGFSFRFKHWILGNNW